MHAQILHFNKCSHRFSVDFIALGVMTVVPPIKALQPKTMQITKMDVVILTTAALFSYFTMLFGPEAFFILFF